MCPVFFLLFPLANSHASSGLLFFFNDTATTEIYTLSLHDAHPIARGNLLTAAQSGRRSQKTSIVAARPQHRERPLGPPAITVLLRGYLPHAQVQSPLTLLAFWETHLTY